jgi:hypothetical protein
MAAWPAVEDAVHDARVAKMRSGLVRYRSSPDAM